MKWISVATLSTIIVIVLIAQACTKEYSCEGCGPGGNGPGGNGPGINKAPIANAGPDQLLALPIDSAFLNGSASSDTDGTIVEYRWTKISGPGAVTIVKIDSAKTWVRNLVAANYQFELRVKDNKGALAKDTVNIQFGNSNNAPPVACAGVDQIVTLPSNSALLDGSCSTDPDNNIAGYAWTKISGPNATIATPNSVSTNVNNLSSGIYQFQLKVTDAAGLFSFDTVQVQVKDQVDVYIAGGIDHLAVYWKNGQVVVLPSNGSAVARSIIVVGNDVYVAGKEMSLQNVVERAVYWKNGQPVYLTNNTIAEAWAITVSGNDVYVAGKEAGVAKYWKNGQAVSLTNVQYDGGATDIQVIGNDIHVTGYEVIFSSTRKARYWKNGVVDSLVSSFSATSIAIAGTDVYLAGLNELNGGSSQAKYWKNGQEVNLMNAPTFSEGHSIAVNNGDVYVSGFDNWVALYWKNGQVIPLTDGSTFATARSIKVFQGDVYVAGIQATSISGFNAAKYWKNGQAITLATGTIGAAALGIFVKAQ